MATTTAAPRTTFDPSASARSSARPRPPQLKKLYPRRARLFDKSDHPDAEDLPCRAINCLNPLNRSCLPPPNQLEECRLDDEKLHHTRRGVGSARGAGCRWRRRRVDIRSRRTGRRCPGAPYIKIPPDTLVFDGAPCLRPPLDHDEPPSPPASDLSPAASPDQQSNPGRFLERGGAGPGDLAMNLWDAFPPSAARPMPVVDGQTPSSGVRVPCDPSASLPLRSRVAKWLKDDTLGPSLLLMVATGSDAVAPATPSRGRPALVVRPTPALPKSRPERAAEVPTLRRGRVD